MPNRKLSILQRNHDQTGWHSSIHFQDDDINNIQVLNSKNDRSLNAIPSPLARIHLFDAAFSLVHQDEIRRTNFSGDAYRKLVSDCFDVFELLYNWDHHEREGKRLKIHAWNKDQEVAKLKQGFLRNKQAREEQIKRSSDENTHINLQQLEGFKEHLVAETLDLYLSSPPFNRFGDIHIITYNDKPIAGTSPLTGFFTTPNDISNIELVNPRTKRNYFSRAIPFAERDQRIKKYIYDFFVNKGSRIFLDRLPIRQYLDRYAQLINHELRLKLAPINSPLNSVFAGNIGLESSIERIDYFEKYLIKINYRLNEDCFHLPRNHKSDRKYDFLLPLTAGFFEDFSLSDISTKVAINEKDSGTVEVIIKKGDETLTKVYRQQPIDSIEGKIVDLANTYQLQVNMGIFPFLKVECQNEIDTINDFYRVMWVIRDNNSEYTNDDFNLNFGKGKEVITPSQSTNYIVSKENRTTLDKANLAGSTYYSLNFCFDFIQVELPRLHNENLRCLIVPKWRPQPIGSKQIDFAIDFGTTTTFVAYTDDPNHQTLPKRFDLDHTQAPVAFLNKPKTKRPELKWIDCYEHFSVLPDFMEFFDIQKQEFVPALLGIDKYSFPFRTVVYEKSNVYATRKKVLSNVNIAFAYQKDFNRYVGIDQEYLTNLKWNIHTNDDYKTSIEAFIEELFQLIKLKTLLIGGNPELTKISWFSPLSFTEGSQFTYSEIWKTCYKKVFKGNPENQLKNITESEAPYYYYSKLMTDSDGTSGIQSYNSVVTLDIGGGTTDFMYFRQGIPTLGSSVNFGANVIWGNGYSEYKNEKSNGIFLALKDKIGLRLRSSELSSGLLKSINEFLTKDESNFGSDEIINFWISNNEDSKILEELKKPEFKFSYLVHLCALIYHASKLLKSNGHPAPNCFIFTGNGSKYLDLIQTKDYIQKICNFIVQEVFKQQEIDNIQIILPTKDRKEATCFGGLYQPFNATRQFEAITHLGFEDTTKSVKRYSDIDLKKEFVFEEVGKSFNDFIDTFFKMNNSPELSFRKHFGIDNNLSAFKNFLLTKCKSNLSTGYDKRRKAVRADDEVTDSLFFYPLLGMIYQMNKLNKDQLEEFIPWIKYFALSPDNESSFSSGRLSGEQRADSIFVISVDSSNPNYGTITLIPDQDAKQRALSGINGFLKTVCNFKEFPDDPSQTIEVVQNGRVERDTQSGEWVVKEKIQIEFQ